MWNLVHKINLFDNLNTYNTIQYNLKCNTPEKIWQSSCTLVGKSHNWP